MDGNDYNNKQIKVIDDLKKEKQRLENEIMLVRERLNLTLSAGNVAWWEMHVPTGMVTFNDNKTIMLGYSEDEFGTVAHYQKFMDLVHPDDYENAMNAMRNHLTGKAELYEVEYRIRMKNGDYKWFYDRGSVTDYDDNKKPLTVKGIVFDNSARKKSEEELKKSELKLRNANAAKNRFFSIIAHDLRSPFSSLIGLTELLYRNFYSYENEKKLNLIERIMTASGNTYNLLINLLDWSRAESDNIQINMQTVNLFESVENVIQLMKANAIKKEITLINNLGQDIHIYADKNLTETVFRNLISNAIKYTRTNGKITVHASMQNSKVEVRVTDNGVGIPAEKISYLFHIDQKYQTPGTDNERGTGLGLLVCKEFMEKNSGSIWVESKLGEGTTFFLTFKKPVSRSRVDGHSS